MNELFFCDKWSGNYKEPRGLMSKSSAEVAHGKRKTYTVLVGSENKPSCVLDVGDGFVFVNFLDIHLRKYLSHQFIEIEPGELFLQQAVERKFKGDSDTVASAKEFKFKIDGVVHVREVTLFPESVVDEYDVLADISGCYEHYPSFGEYESLIIRERNIQPV